MPFVGERAGERRQARYFSYTIHHLFFHIPSLTVRIASEESSAIVCVTDATPSQQAADTDLGRDALIRAGQDTHQQPQPCLQSAPATTS